MQRDFSHVTKLHLKIDYNMIEQKMQLICQVYVRHCFLCGNFAVINGQKILQYRPYRERENACLCVGWGDKQRVRKERVEVARLLFVIVFSFASDKMRQKCGPKEIEEMEEDNKRERDRL